MPARPSDAGSTEIQGGVVYANGSPAVLVRRARSALPIFRVGAGYPVRSALRLVLFVSKAVQVYLGNVGVYLSNALASLTDVDAITLSMARLAGDDVCCAMAARAVTLAALSNTIVKGGFAVSLGSSLRRYVLPIFRSSGDRYCLLVSGVR